MKNHTLLSKLRPDLLSNTHFLLIWLVFHLGFLLFFGITYATNRENILIDADLFNMFPKSFNEESIRKADEKLTEITGQNVFVLVVNEDFDTAKNCAVTVYEQLQHSDNFQSINLYSDFSDYSSLLDTLYAYRFNLLDDQSIALIQENPQLFAENALITAYSPFTLLPLDTLEEDPFLISETVANNYLNAAANTGIAMSTKDGVLAAEHNGNWYVMIRGILSKKGAALASRNNGVSELYEVCNSISGCRFIYSGTPVNSHQSSNSAMKEISIITTVSLLVVVIMLLTVFKSPIPILCSVASIFVSIVSAFLATLAVFHQMHILTLVFGTSLIGSCIDYSLHYFTHWAGNKNLVTGKEIREHLISGLSMAIISSGICYIILLFAPFNLLKQMSLFSIVGLISSYLTTLCLYPYIKMPETNREIALLKLMKPVQNKNRRKLIGRIAITTLFAFSIGSILLFHSRFTIHNDLFKLYTMKGQLLEDRLETVEIIRYNPTGWFILRGDSENDVLQKEERLCQKLQETSPGTMSYLATSKFIPSKAHQERSRQAYEKLLALSDQQFEALGYDESYSDQLWKDFYATEGQYLSFSGNTVPEYVASLISTAWLGEMNGKYFSVVMPNIIEDPKALKNLVEDETDIFFISKMADMGEDLDKLTVMVLKFFAGAYIVMFIILKFFYPWKQALKIISIPLLIVLMTGAVFAWGNINLEFFSVTGLILVFGLGLDYIIYMMENEKDRTNDSKTIEPFATLLSFVSTVVSFGALALSSFQPVHLMGLSIFLGLTTAFISTMFYDRSM